MKPCLILLIFMFSSWPLMAQNPQQETPPEDGYQAMQLQLKKLRQRMHESLQNFQQMDGLGDMDQLLEKFRQDFFNRDFDNFKNLDKFLDDFNGLSHTSDRNYSWSEKPNERILEFDFKAPKDSPVDIKIKDRMVTIKGKSLQTNERLVNGGLQKIQSMTEFNQSLMIPEDVDAQKAKIEQTKTGIRIKFPKLEGPENNNGDRKPLKPGNDAKTI